MLYAHEMKLPPIEETPGASCPKKPSACCDVPEWIYVTDTAFPRMYGRCIECDTRYAVVLPMRFGYRNSLVEDVIRERFLKDETRDEIVVNATESVLRRSGNAQRLWFTLHSRPLSITRDILCEVEKASRRAVEEAIRPRESQLNDLLELVHRRVEQVGAEYRRLSAREIKGAAKKALETLTEIRDAIKREQPLLTKIRTERRGILAEIKRERDAARREPLPIPASYQAPPINERSVLCDALAPGELIYALIDPSDPELVRYVGRTYDPVGRYRAHCTSGSDALTTWAQGLIAAGRSPVMVLIERCDGVVVVERERHWIHYYRDRFQADLNRSLPRRLDVNE